MYAAHVQDVGRQQHSGLGDVMAVDEHHGRLGGLGGIVRPASGSALRVPPGQPAVRVHGRVGQPVAERAERRAVQQVRHVRRVGRVAHDGRLHVRDHGRGHHVHHGQTDRGGQVGHALGAQRLGDQQVEPGRRFRAVHHERSDLFHVVHRVAELSAPPDHGRHDVRQPAVVVQQGGRPFARVPRQHRGRVHFRVVAAATAVARGRRVRRERHHGVAAIGQRPEHGAHKVPVTAARHGAHGQYVGRATPAATAVRYCRDCQRGQRDSPDERA